MKAMTRFIQCATLIFCTLYTYVYIDRLLQYRNSFPKDALQSSSRYLTTNAELLLDREEYLEELEQYEMKGADETTEIIQSIVSEKHKDLFPLDNSDIWGTIFVTVGLMVAAAGGVGGGGILVPLFLLVFGFNPKSAIALSNFCILGSSITNMIMNFFKRHPLADRPLVDWDLILVMEPLTMAGAVVGAFVGKVLPDWILVVALVFLLAYTTWNTVEKAISQFKKETKKMLEAKKSVLSKTIDRDVERDEQQTLLPPSESTMSRRHGNPVTFVPPDGESLSEEDKKENLKKFDEAIEKTLDEKELESLLAEEKTTPLDKVVIITIMIVVVMVLNLIKGGGKGFRSPLGIECGSFSYWFVTALVFAWLFAISIWMREILISKWKLKKRLRYKYIDGDMEWNPINTLTYPSLCFFAGFCAGVFGIGGGIIKGPLMLAMGVHPEVASATCAVMIMFTSVAATTMFIAFGTLIWDYGWYFFFLGLGATVIGQYVVSYFVVKYGRASLISFSIAAVVGLSTLLMSVQSIISMMSDTPSDSTGICN